MRYYIIAKVLDTSNLEELFIIHEDFYFLRHIDINNYRREGFSFKDKVEAENYLNNSGLDNSGSGVLKFINYIYYDKRFKIRSIEYEIESEEDMYNRLLIREIIG